MFFFLSQVFYFLFTPLSWILGLLVYAAFSKNKVRKKSTFISGIALLYIFSNSFIRDEVFREWEVQTVRDEWLKDTFDVAIVLGGGMVTYDIRYDRTNFVHNNDRILQAVRLYKSGKVRKILISSGDANLIKEGNVESDLIKQYFVSIGIPDSVLISENQSMNTYENAVNTKKILDKQYPNGKFLLITSASHMRRAFACFLKQGIKVLPYSVDRQAGKRKFYFSHLLIPESRNLVLWSRLLHEWCGYFTYWVMGYV